MKEIIEKIKAMDKEELDKAVRQAREFAKTPKGKELAEKIKSGEAMKNAGIDEAQQKNIMKELGKNPSIAQTIFDILNEKR